MKAELSRNSDGKQIVILPVDLGTPVYIIKSCQHDGWWCELREYSLEYFGEDVYVTRAEAEQYCNKMNKKKFGEPWKPFDERLEGMKERYSK